MEQSKRILNFIYFYRRRIGIAAGFTSLYGYICKKSVNAHNEIYKQAIAGSLSYLIVESSFHFVDTVNVRAKVSE